MFQKKSKAARCHHDSDDLKKARISAYSLQDQWVVGRHGSVGTREQADKNGSSKLQFSAATHLIRSKVSIRENFAPKLPKICPNQPAVGSHPAHYRHTARHSVRQLWRTLTSSTTSKMASSTTSSYGSAKPPGCNVLKCHITLTDIKPPRPGTTAAAHGQVAVWSRK